MVKRIVITGGPCAGKSTALPILAEHLRGLGLNVITMSETATDLMRSGFAPDAMKSRVDFQSLNIEFMVTKMRLFEYASANLPSDNTVILCDRGLCDCSTYMSDSVFCEQLARHGLTAVTARDSYDAVFHMESCAKCAPHAYRNDDIRHESIREASELDEAAMRAWVGNPHWRMVSDDGSGFDAKINDLKKKVTAFLGIPKSLEIERKFLISYPDLLNLSKRYICKTVDIKQTYISLPSGNKSRIRMRGDGDDLVYIMTTKKKISNIVREETEEQITRDKYENLLQYADPSGNPIIKKRMCIIANGKYFELDLFPFWQDRAILEIELDSESEEFVIPDGIHVIREVTHDPAYSNFAMTRVIPD